MTFLKLRWPGGKGWGSLCISDIVIYEFLPRINGIGNYPINSQPKVQHTTETTPQIPHQVEKAAKATADQVGKGMLQIFKSAPSFIWLLIFLHNICMHWGPEKHNPYKEKIFC